MHVDLGSFNKVSLKGATSDNKSASANDLIVLATAGDTQCSLKPRTSQPNNQNFKSNVKPWLMTPPHSG